MTGSDLTVRRRVCLVGVGLMLAACRGGSARARGPLPVGSPVVVVTMRDDTFEYRGPIPAGRVVFRVRNAGQHLHNLTLSPLPDDIPPINDQLHGSTRRTLDDLARTNPSTPGRSATFAVDLVAGRRYAMLCFILDPGEDESHAFKGMTSEFRPQPPS